jgi:hypothetical protein
MSTTQITLTIVVIIVLIAAAAAGWYLMRRRSLRERFGPEYDRVLAESDSRSAAERELRARERHHAELDIHPLSPQSRQQYVEEWEALQIRFIDDPAGAVRAGDELVTRLAAERGYPTEDLEANLSVEHGHTLGKYREAHEIAERNESGEATTEQLRMALMHYRALFSELADVPDTTDVDRPDVSQQSTRR